MRTLFVIQGEGRGHMTQALALRGMLERAGHPLAAVLVGRSRRRRLPDFFVRKIGAPVETFDSPNFASDGQDRGIRLAPTVLHNARHLRRFAAGFDVLDAALRRYRPDLLVNFYEPLAGLFNAWHRPGVPMVSVGHQYMFHHPAYTFPEGAPVDQAALRFFTHVTALGAVRRLALSLYPAPDRPEAGITVVPPILRREVFRQRAVAEQVRAERPRLLVYLLNSGYAQDVQRWHADHPEVHLDVFWDRADASEVEWVDETLTFHRLHDQKFLALMARCSGLVCTSGFESVSEAMYLGKPILAVPVEGHFEQRCNAREVEALGGGLHSPRFDLGRLVRYLSDHTPDPAPFRRWVDSAERRCVGALERAADVPAARLAA